VEAGARLGVLVPPGPLKVIASFSPTSLGRLKVGAEGRMRLTGFAWTQHGFLDAKVARIASEVREGAVRVELEVLPTGAHSLPLQHGLQGSVEVLVERVSPAWLVFRYVGRVLLRRSAAGEES
jgi:membrane fusion protein (multidrug efflux system)